MLLQRVLVLRRVATALLRTLEGALIRVHTHMLANISQCRAGVVAASDGALERPLGGVCQHVGFECAFGLGAEGTALNVAFEGTFGCV